MECPVCKQRMKHEHIANAWVDVCEEHGIWLDKGEIDVIMSHAKEKGESEAFVKGLWYNTHSH